MATTAGRKAFIVADHSGNVTPAAPVRSVTGGVTKVICCEVTSEEVPSPDIVILNPPRPGAGKDAVAAITEAKPRVTAHFGCNSATFARDVRYWTDYGYVLKHLEIVDTFGLTHHFEAIAVLERL